MKDKVEKGMDSKCRIVTFTTEGAMCITDISYVSKEEIFLIEEDDTRDGFSAQRTITRHSYSQKAYDFILEDNSYGEVFTYLKVKEKEEGQKKGTETTSEAKNGDVLICVYPTDTKQINKEETINEQKN